MANLMGNYVPVRPIVDIHYLLTANHSDVGIVAASVLNVDVVPGSGAFCERQCSRGTPCGSRIAPVLTISARNSGVESIVDDSVGPAIPGERAVDRNAFTYYKLHIINFYISPSLFVGVMWQLR